MAKVDYDRAIADGSAAAFNDLHVADGKAVIAVSKTVNGSSTVKPNETFEFALYQADADGKGRQQDHRVVLGQIAEKQAHDVLRVRRLRKKVATCGVRSCAVSHSP